MTDAQLLDYLDARLKFSPFSMQYDVVIGDVPLTFGKGKTMREVLRDGIEKHAGAVIAAKLLEGDPASNDPRRPGMYTTP